MDRERESAESCRERKSDESLMKFDRRMNMTTLQSLSMKSPKASVRLVILLPIAQCFNPDQLERCQFGRKGRGQRKLISR